jgi:hypothetical protein
MIGISLTMRGKPAIGAGAFAIAAGQAPAQSAPTRQRKMPPLKQQI